MPRHKYFTKTGSNAFSVDGLIVPETAMNLRNDCKEAAWYLGETPYGNRLKFVCLKFSRRIAVEDYGAIEPGTPLGQLWFAPVLASESPEGRPLPTNVVYYTLLKNSKSGKSGSLINFGQKAVLAQSQGYDYREVLWTATFKKKSATIEGEAVSYYVLDFDYSEPDEAVLKRIDQIVAVLESEEELSKMFDPTLESATRCIDGFKPDAIAQLVENLRASRMALPVS